MRYALIAYARPGAYAAMTDDERAAWEADDAEFFAELIDHGWFVSGVGLADPDTATTVRVQNGRAVLTDGPFAEVVEHLGGILFIDVPDLDTALDLAQRCPAARTGPLEVRPVRT
jgi:hypothetical protein